MTETLEQIALRIAEEYDPEERYLPYRNDVVEFAKRLVKALGAQEPVTGFNDWSRNGKYVPLYAAPKL